VLVAEFGHLLREVVIIPLGECYRTLEHRL
jgi:hypothetical protein